MTYVQVHYQGFHAEFDRGDESAMQDYAALCLQLANDGVCFNVTYERN